MLAQFYKKYCNYTVMMHSFEAIKTGVTILRSWTWAVGLQQLTRWMRPAVADPTVKAEFKHPFFQRYTKPYYRSRVHRNTQKGLHQI